MQPLAIVGDKCTILYATTVSTCQDRINDIIATKLKSIAALIHIKGKGCLNAILFRLSEFASMHIHFSYDSYPRKSIAVLKRLVDPGRKKLKIP